MGQTRPQLLDGQEVARWFGVPRRTVWAMVRRDEIPVVRISPRHLRFDPQLLELWLDRRTIQRPQHSRSYASRKRERR